LRDGGKGDCSGVPRESELLTHFMARPKKTPSKEKPTLYVHTMTLTMADKNLLQQLGADVTDYIGRTVSGSAIVRALLRYAKQQKEPWLTSQLCPLVEEELASGIMWGKKK
jgi:hypothetical protein